MENQDTIPALNFVKSTFTLFYNVNVEVTCQVSLMGVTVFVDAPPENLEFIIGSSGWRIRAVRHFIEAWGHSNGFNIIIKVLNHTKE